ncbi:MAG TPA: hypothetical protein VIT93_02835 [Dehalococcoidia bacterium]
MSRTPGLSFRPALAVAIALATASLIFLASQQATEAGAANSLTISPVDREIGVGATASVSLVSTPPAESLAVWVIDVVFDPAVVSVDSCTPAASPPGSVAVSHCETDDQADGPDEETVVSLGGILFTDTGRGLDDQTTLATITFSAVGAIGQCSDLTINVVSHLGPGPSGVETNPTTTDGEICVVEDAGVDRIWGDHNCSGAADPIDALLTLRYDAGLSANTGECPDFGQVVEVAGASPHPWGDVDCMNGVSPVDSLKLLRFDVGLNVSQAQGCPKIGTTVSVSE